MRGFAIFNRSTNDWPVSSKINYDWHFIIVTVSATAKNLYVDGKFISSKNITTPIDILQNNNLRIGAHINDGSQQMHGNIDDVRIYNRVLTDFEIQQLYYECR